MQNILGRSKQNKSKTYVLLFVLAALWISFFDAGHSLTSEAHHPLALSAHIDQHHLDHDHFDDAVEQDHSHPQKHEHEDQYIFTNAPLLFVPFLIVLLLLASPALKFFRIAKTNSSFFLQYILSRHRTIVLRN